MPATTPVTLAPFVLLEIEDGDPWYLSPNVWTVPGTNPEGPPGLPIAGKPAYLWARLLRVPACLWLRVPRVPAWR